MNTEGRTDRDAPASGLRSLRLPEESSIDDLAARHAAYRHWVETVRDPATTATEGLRIIEAKGTAANASYEVAPLPDGRWAIRVRCEYNCGDYHGVGIPWTDFPTRDDCIEFFLTTARRHFGYLVNSRGSSLQQQAQAEMRRLLKPGLFGFIEPSPSREYEVRQRAFFPNEENDDGEDEATTCP